MQRLLVNAHVVTMDGDRRLFDPGFVLIGPDGRIAATGPMSDCPPAPDTERIDGSGRVVLPGFVDLLHRHWVHLFPDGAAAGDHARPRGVEAHALLGRIAAGALASGGVTSLLLDMPPGMTRPEVEAVAAAFEARGLRAVPALPPDLAPHFAGAVVKVQADVAALADGRTDEGAIRAAFELARAQGRRVLIQPWPADATPEALAAALARRGRSTVHHLMELGLLDHGCLMVCPPVLDDLDRALILESECHLIGTPVADAGLGRASTALSAMVRAGAWCGLGSGGPAPGWTADMVEQMKMAVLAQNTQMLDPCALSVEQALAMATSQGAAALGLSASTGMIAPGMDADLVVFDLARPEVQVPMKPVAALVACLRGHHAELVLARGRPVGAPHRPDPDDLAAARALRRSPNPGTAA